MDETASDSDCESLILSGLPLQANPDIAGLGVILAFLISAYIVQLWTVFAYFFGIVPPELLRAVDRRVFGANSARANSKWRRSFQQATITFSDQQIVTGIAILLAGFINLQSGISVYHWQRIIYLAWMSSNVHLATITMLRGWLHDNKVLRHWRVAGMVILVGLLCAALVPTSSGAWFSAVNDVPLDQIDDSMKYSTPSYPPGMGLGTPAACYFSRYPNGVNENTPYSYGLLILSYVSRIGHLYDGSRHFMRRWTRCGPEAMLERIMKKALARPLGWTLFHRVKLRILMLTYVSLVAWCEYVESFAASMSLLIVGLGWGTLMIFTPGHLAPASIRSQERTWSFGQLLPLLMLLQPAVSLLGHFYGEKQSEEVSQAVEMTTPDYSGSLALLPRQSHLGRTISFRNLLCNLRCKSAYDKARSIEPEPQITFMYTSR